MQNYMRDYDPGLGRYRQADPIGLAGGLNRFPYAEANALQLTDALGLQTLICRSPLSALKKGVSPDFAKWGMSNVPKLYHEYLCIPDGRGGWKCDGQDQRGEKWFDPIWGPGAHSAVRFEEGVCKEVAASNSCVEQCIDRAFASPRPTYGIPFATDCQEWAQQALDNCKFQCSSTQANERPFIGYRPIRRSSN